jgi:hypothetical protein
MLSPSRSIGTDNRPQLEDSPSRSLGTANRPQLEDSPSRSFGTADHQLEDSPSRSFGTTDHQLENSPPQSSGTANRRQLEEELFGSDEPLSDGTQSDGPLSDGLSDDTDTDADKLKTLSPRTFVRSPPGLMDLYLEARSVHERAEVLRRFKRTPPWLPGKGSVGLKQRKTTTANTAKTTDTNNITNITTTNDKVSISSHFLACSLLNG